jgi:hypothetical protein
MTYDAEGRTHTLKYPKDGTFILGYDAADRPVHLHKDTAPPEQDELQATVTYDWRGLMTEMTRPDGAAAAQCRCRGSTRHESDHPLTAVAKGNRWFEPPAAPGLCRCDSRPRTASSRLGNG